MGYKITSTNLYFDSVITYFNMSKCNIKYEGSSKGFRTFIFLRER